MVRKLGTIFVVLALAVGVAGATTLIKMSFGDLAREAGSIVVGTVTSVEGEWDPTLEFIRSNVTIDVESSLRGRASKQVVLRTLGGWVGGTGQKANGVAEFEVGERVLVFLTSWEDGTPKVLGYIQGKSRVVRDAQGMDRLVGGAADGLTIEGARREIERGPANNIPLRPAK